MPSIPPLPLARAPQRVWTRRLAWAAGWFAVTVQAQVPDPGLLQHAQRVFQPLPKDLATAGFPIPPARVALGRQLFFDVRLSADGTVSCRTCHLPERYGADGLSKSVGVARRLNARNAPTVLNAALQFKAHWDGGRDSVEDQATKALIGPASFGNPDYPTVIQKLKALGYESAFNAAFPGDPEPIKPDNWGKAIGSYERTLVTPAPFDAYLQGQPDALPEAAQRGLKTFIETGCASCHGGVGLGGTAFQKFGVVSDYWLATGNPERDSGRFGITQDPADQYRFKVPGLRNVAMTAPYFHDGSVADLAQAVRIMGQVQLGQTLTPAQVADLVAFLNSLTGTVPQHFAPESSPIAAP